MLSPNTPWQVAHLVSHNNMPSATLPRPAGRPLKSARTSMSQAATSCTVALRPMPANVLPVPLCANVAMLHISSAAANPACTPQRRRSAQLHIGDLTTFSHRPGLNGVVVIDRTVAANSAQLAVVGLYVT